MRVSVLLAASSGKFLMRAAIAAEGLVQLPSFYVYEALRTRQLLPLLTDHVWPELAAYAVYPPTRHLSRRARAFVDFLALTRESYWDRMD